MALSQDEKAAAETVLSAVPSERSYSEADLSSLDGLGFCDVWPTARGAIELLRDNVFGGSGVLSRLVRWGLGEAIDAGDRKCGGS